MPVLQNFQKPCEINDEFWIVYWFQASLVFVYLGAFGIAAWRNYGIADFLISPLIATTYFLVLKVFTHRISPLTTILITLTITILIDFIFPLVASGPEHLLKILENYWLVTLLVILEIVMEESVEDIQQKVAYSRQK